MSGHAIPQQPPARRAPAQRLLVLDAVGFHGGSKVATGELLRQVARSGVEITVLSATPTCWLHAPVHCRRLIQLPWLRGRQRGAAYLLRHLVIALNLLWLLSRRRCDALLGAATPTVDLALYLIAPLGRWRLIQLVHGDVAPSRLVARMLGRAHHIFCLPAARSTVETLLARLPRAQRPPVDDFVNGLGAERWPTRADHRRPGVLWCASLLRWKGLDTLLDALSLLPPQRRPDTSVCYLRPRDVRLPVTQAPRELAGVRWYEAPAHLDAIRASATVFVSTSEAEPFGLSILEALAAGLCVVIPRDGAWWDTCLTDEVDCVKYPPGDAAALAAVLRRLQADPALAARIGERGTAIAERYRADVAYARAARLIAGRERAPDAGEAAA